MSITFGKRKPKIAHFFPVWNEEQNNEVCTNTLTQSAITYSSKENKSSVISNVKNIETLVVKASSTQNSTLDESSPCLNSNKLIKTSHDDDDYSLTVVPPNHRTYSRGKINIPPKEKFECKQNSIDVSRTVKAEQIEDDPLQVKHVVDLKRINVKLPCDKVMKCYGSFGNLLSHGLGKDDGLVKIPMDFSEESSFSDLGAENDFFACPALEEHNSKHNCRTFSHDFTENIPSKENSNHKFPLKNPESEIKVSNQNKFVLKHLPGQREVHFGVSPEVTDDNKMISYADQIVSNINEVISERQSARCAKKRPSVLKVKFPKNKKVLKGKSNSKTSNISTKSKNEDVKKSSDSNLDNCVTNIKSDKIEDDPHVLQQNQERYVSSSQEIRSVILPSNENKINIEPKNQNSVKQDLGTKMTLVKVEFDEQGLEGNQSKQNLPLVQETEYDTNKKELSKTSMKGKPGVPIVVKCEITEQKTNKLTLKDVNSKTQITSLVKDEKDSKLNRQEPFSSKTFGQIPTIISEEISTSSELKVSNQGKREECNFLIKPKVEKDLDLIIKSKITSKDESCETMTTNLLKSEHEKGKKSSSVNSVNEINQTQQHINRGEEQPVSQNKLTYTLNGEEHAAKVAKKIMHYITQNSEIIESEETSHLLNLNHIDTITMHPDLVNKWHSVQNNQHEMNDKHYFSADEKTIAISNSNSHVLPVKFVISNPSKKSDQKFVSQFSTVNAKLANMQPAVSLIDFVKDSNEFIKQVKDVNEHQCISEALKHFNKPGLSSQENCLESNNEDKLRYIELNKELDIETNIQCSISSCISINNAHFEAHLENETSIKQNTLSDKPKSRQKNSSPAKITDTNMKQRVISVFECKNEKYKKGNFQSLEIKNNMTCRDENLVALNNDMECHPVNIDMNKNFADSDNIDIKNNDTAHKEDMKYSIEELNQENGALCISVDNLLQYEKQEFISHQENLGDQNVKHDNLDTSPHRNKNYQSNIKATVTGIKQCLSKTNQDSVNKRENVIPFNSQAWEQVEAPETRGNVMLHSEVEANQMTDNMQKKFFTMLGKSSDLKKKCKEHKEIKLAAPMFNKADSKPGNSSNVKKKQMESKCVETRINCSEDVLSKVSLCQNVQESNEIHNHVQFTPPKVTENKNISEFESVSSSDVFSSNVNEKVQSKSDSMLSIDENCNFSKEQYLKNSTEAELEGKIQNENSTSSMSKLTNNKTTSNEDQILSKLHPNVGKKSKIEIKLPKTQNTMINSENKPMINIKESYTSFSHLEGSPKSKTYKKNTSPLNGRRINKLCERKRIVQPGLNEAKDRETFLLNDSVKCANKTVSSLTSDSDKLNEIVRSVSCTEKGNDTIAEASSKTSESSLSAEESASEAEFPCLSIEEVELLKKKSTHSSVSFKSESVSKKFLKSLQLVPKDCDDVSSHEVLSQVNFKRPSLPEIISTHYYEKEEVESPHKLQRKNSNKQKTIKKYFSELKELQSNEQSVSPLKTFVASETASTVHDKESSTIPQICAYNSKNSSPCKTVECVKKVSKAAPLLNAKSSNNCSKMNQRKSKPLSICEPNTSDNLNYENANLNETSNSYEVKIINGTNGLQGEDINRKRMKRRQCCKKIENIHSVSTSSSNVASSRRKRKVHDDDLIKASNKIPKNAFLDRKIENSESPLKQLPDSSNESEGNEDDETVVDSIGLYSIPHHVSINTHCFRNQSKYKKKTEKILNHSKGVKAVEKSTKTAETQTPYDTENIRYVHPNAPTVLNYNPFMNSSPHFALPFNSCQIVNSPLNPYFNSHPNLYLNPSMPNPSFQQASGFPLMGPLTMNAFSNGLSPQVTNESLNTDNNHSAGNEESDIETKEQISYSKSHGDLLIDLMFFCTDIAFVNTKSFIEASKMLLLNPYVKKSDVYSTYPVRTFCTSPIVMNTLSKLTCNKTQDFPEPALFEYTFKDGFEDDELLTVVKDYVKFHFINLKKKYSLELESGLFNKSLLENYVFNYLNFRDTVFMRLLCFETEENYTIQDLFLILSFSALLSIFDEFKKGTFFR